MRVFDRTFMVLMESMQEGIEDITGQLLQQDDLFVSGNGVRLMNGCTYSISACGYGDQVMTLQYFRDSEDRTVALVYMHNLQYACISTGQEMGLYRVKLVDRDIPTEGRAAQFFRRFPEKEKAIHQIWEEAEAEHKEKDTFRKRNEQCGDNGCPVQEPVCKAFPNGRFNKCRIIPDVHCCEL